MEIKEGEPIAVCKGNRIILGRAAVVEAGLLAMNPMLAKSGETEGITDEKVYSIKQLIDSYENQSTGSGQRNRTYRDLRENRRPTQSELLAVGVLKKLEEQNPELSSSLGALDQNTIQMAKALLQTMLEEEGGVNYRALNYKARKRPERQRK